MSNPQPSRKAKRKSKHLYSEGQRNKLIDAIMDPLAKQDDFFVLIDGVLHFLNEGDHGASLVKFAKYSLPELLERWTHQKKVDSFRLQVSSFSYSEALSLVSSGPGL